MMYPEELRGTGPAEVIIKNQASSSDIEALQLILQDPGVPSHA